MLTDWVAMEMVKSYFHSLGFKCSTVSLETCVFVSVFKSDSFL